MDSRGGKLFVMVSSGLRSLEVSNREPYLFSGDGRLRVFQAFEVWRLHIEPKWWEGRTSTRSITFFQHRTNLSDSSRYFRVIGQTVAGQADPEFWSDRPARRDRHQVDGRLEVAASDFLNMSQEARLYVRRTRSMLSSISIVTDGAKVTGGNRAGVDPMAFVA